MKAKSYEVDQILLKKNIDDYLMEMGLNGTASSKGRTLFCCPIHQEDTPSFVVYPPTEEYPYQSYYCFGCKSNGNLITLKMLLEKVTFKQAIGNLSTGIEIKVQDQLEYQLERITSSMKENLNFDVEVYMLMISRSIYNHLNVVEKDCDQIAACEKILKIVDDCCMRRDTAKLKTIWNELPDVLAEHAQKVQEEKDRQNMEAVRVYSKI